MAKKTPWKKIGVIGVDAGLCWIGDPCYCVTPDASSHPAKTWDEFCEKLGLDKPTNSKQWDYSAGNPGLGVSVSTGYGDGVYSVFAKEEESFGRIAEVKIVFI